MKVKASMGRLLKKRLASFPPLWVATTLTKVVDKRRVVGSRLLKLQPLSPLRLQVNFCSLQHKTIQFGARLVDNRTKIHLSPL